MSFSRFSALRSSLSLFAAKTRASSVTCQKSAYRCATTRSHVYSNWRVRHSSLSASPFPGKSSSARAKTGLGSKIGNASNAMALIFVFGACSLLVLRDRDPKAQEASPAAVRDINSLRFIGLSSLCVGVKAARRLGIGCRRSRKVTAIRNIAEEVTQLPGADDTLLATAVRLLPFPPEQCIDRQRTWPTQNQRCKSSKI